MTKVPKEYILSEIRRIASENGGKAPGIRMFGAETGLPRSSWEGAYWSRWSDALAEAGMSPNEKNQKIEMGEIFPMLIAACRRYGRRPSLVDLQLFRRTQDAAFPIAAIRKRLGVDHLWISFEKWLITQGAEVNDVLDLLANDERPQVEGGPVTETVKSNEDGFVYLLQSGEHYKIGRSDDIERRVREVRTQMPSSLKLIHSIRTDDPLGIERYWLERFSQQRANGEWFRLSRKDISAFKRRKFQ